MCDEEMLSNWARKGFSRREFAGFGAASALAACAPKQAAGEGAPEEVTETPASIATADGTMDGILFSAGSEARPGVLFWPDIAGIREAKRVMARRLAQAGYAVLLANPYYRDASGEQFADIADFYAKDGFARVTPWRNRFSAATVKRDAEAVVEWMKGQKAVDAGRKMGSQGYCMTGSFALWTATLSTSVGAAASFHGGGLVQDEATSPHRAFRKDGSYLVAIARNDDNDAPGDKTALREAVDAAGAKAEIEVYPADHGWCVLDSPTYDEMQAERAWSRMLALYASAL